jgi:hypothetical protein
MGRVEIFIFSFYTLTLLALSGAVSTYFKFRHPPVRIKHYFEAEKCLYTYDLASRAA